MILGVCGVLTAGWGACRALQPGPLKRFDCVASGLLYRSQQPDRLDMRDLESLGIRTVISLREYHSDADEATGTGLQTKHIRIDTAHITEAEVVEFLRIVEKKEDGPFLVHCWHGSDRTGFMVAMYRRVVENWDAPKAWAELSQPKFDHHEKTYPNIKTTLFDEEFVARVKEQAGRKL